MRFTSLCCSRAAGGGAVIQSTADYEKAEQERDSMRAMVAGLAVLETGCEVSLEEDEVRHGLKFH